MTAPSAPRRLVIAAGHFFFRHRNLLFPLVFIPLFFVAGPNDLFRRNAAGRLLKILGVLLVVCGQAFRLLVIGYAYIKRGGKDGKVFADKLVIRGFYAHTRNPMYMGNVTILLGFCLLYQSVWSYVAVLPFFLFAYYAIVVAEETYLAARFGPEYEQYTRAVNRFIPNFHGIQKSLSEFQYDWKRALRKDYGNVTLALFAVLAIKVRENLGPSSQLTPSELPFFSLALLAVVVFYLVARILKKTGRLASPN